MNSIKNRLKFLLFRKYISTKNYLNNVKNKLDHDTETHDNLPIQVKSTKLWKLLLKDSESVISCSMVNKIRQIEKDNMLVTMKPMNERDCLMTIMDVDDNKSCLYEIRFGNKSSLALMDLFDIENERRMLLGQSEKRDSIHNDLDKLLKQQDDVLRRQKRNQPVMG
jgi:hypothetical protein